MAGSHRLRATNVFRQSAGSSSVVLVLEKQVRPPISEVEESEDHGENDARHDVNALGTRWKLFEKEKGEKIYEK